MNIGHLLLNTFRNYAHLDLHLPQEGAVFEGINGAGKTNILEAIYMLCTGRSQRSAKRMEMINFEAQNSYLEGEFKNKDSLTIASMGFGRDKKSPDENKWLPYQIFY